MATEKQGYKSQENKVNRERKAQSKGQAKANKTANRITMVNEAMKYR